MRKRFFTTLEPGIRLAYKTILGYILKRIHDL